MKAQLNLSIDIKTAQMVEEMKEKGILPSHIFTKLMKEMAANDFKLPVTIKADEAVI